MLDPVYTAKALALVPPGRPVVFWHTGGVLDAVAAAQEASLMTPRGGRRRATVPPGASTATAPRRARRRARQRPSSSRPGSSWRTPTRASCTGG